ncbi:MAG: hypothetical protein ACRC9Q_02010 [Bacteroidales bacterium]
MKRIILSFFFLLLTLSVSSQIVDQKHDFDATQYLLQNKPKIKKLTSNMDNNLLTIKGGFMLFPTNELESESPYYRNGISASLDWVRFVNNISGFGMNFSFQGGDLQKVEDLNNQILSYSAGAQYYYTLLGRYNFEKALKMYWSTGVNVGMSQQDQNYSFIYGASTGLILDYRFSSAFHLNTEFKVNFWNEKFDQIGSFRKFDSTISLLVGLGYSF